MELGGGEVHVARHVLAVADHDLAENVLRGATLVGGDDVLVAEDFPEHLREPNVLVAVGSARAGGVVGGPLVGAHRRGPRVGQQVDCHVGRTKEERVVAGFTDRLFALLAGEHTDVLDGVNLIGERIELVGREVRELRAIVELITPAS